MNKLVDLHRGRHKSTQDQPLTFADLETFRVTLVNDLLKGIKLIICDQPQGKPRKWLKSREVKTLLEISSGTLQTLRDKGMIPHCKIGGIFYYDPMEIDKEIEKRKSKGRNRHDQYPNGLTGA
jgi:hypothetical protein